jgi:hypothetical protein
VWAVGAYPVVTFSPGQLECRFCGLKLDGEEEWPRRAYPRRGRDNVNPSDFEEPDYAWDDYRD